MKLISRLFRRRGNSPVIEKGPKTFSIEYIPPNASLPQNLNFNGGVVLLDGYRLVGGFISELRRTHYIADMHGNTAPFNYAETWTIQDLDEINSWMFGNVDKFDYFRGELDRNGSISIGSLSNWDTSDIAYRVRLRFELESPFMKSEMHLLLLRVDGFLTNNLNVCE